MAQYNGYVSIVHSSYSEWRSATLGNGYDADGYYGNQCWDFAAEFWYNVGFPQGYPQTGGNNAKGIWEQRATNKEYNSGNQFSLITSISDLQVGDVICFSYGDYGHVGFLDEAYTSGDYFVLLSQNNNSQMYVTSANYRVATFMGAFRYNAWHTTPTSAKRTHFPWVLYARKLRERR